MPSALLAPVLACAIAAGACSPVAAAASRVGPRRHRIPVPVFRPAFESSIRNGETGVQPERPLVLEASLPSHVSTALVGLVKNHAITLEDRCDGKSQVVAGSADVLQNATGRRKPAATKRTRLSFLPAGGWKPGAVHSVTLHAGKIALWKASFTTAPAQSPPEGDPGPEPDPDPGPTPDPEPDPGPGPGEEQPGPGEQPGDGGGTQPDPEPEPPAPAQPDVYTLTGRFGWGSLDPDTITFSVSKRTTITVSYNSLETVNTQYHQERLYFILTREGEKGREYSGGGEYWIELEAGNYTIRASSSLGTSRATMTVTVPRD